MKYSLQNSSVSQKSLIVLLTGIYQTQMGFDHVFLSVWTGM